MPATVIASHTFASEFTGKPYVSSFGTHSVLRYTSLQTSQHGGDFETTYRQQVNDAAHRSAPDSLNKIVFPSHLVGPNGNTFPTSEPYPDYIVISYTWGRWKRETRDWDTPVQGGHWKAPANDQFTRADLDNAVRKIGDGMNVWIDVLCIPQTDSDPGKAREIGKQGEIFRSAARAVVWLCTGGDEVLVDICSAVPEKMYMIPPDALALNNPENIVEARRRLRQLIKLTEVVPWTTSLWTLQEAALRLDAVFYSKSGHPLRHRQSKNLLTVKHLARTLAEIEDALSCLFQPSNRSLHGILGKPEAWGMSEEDVSLVFQAMDSVNNISLHRLVNMNAAELLLASTHRVCERPHDRAYGIMSAIGVVIPVDYSEDEDKVMNRFLVELHNRVPAEMQAFQHPRTAKGGNRGQWFVNEESIPMTLIRQDSPPSLGLFSDVTDEGYLILKGMIPVTQSGMDELTTRALTESILPAIDEQSFYQLVEDGLQYGRKLFTTTNLAYVELCSLMKQTLTKARLALIFLGSVSGLESLGWRYMYLLLGSKGTIANNSSTEPGEVFQRLGFVLVGDELVAETPVQGQFYIS